MVTHSPDWMPERQRLNDDYEARFALCLSRLAIQNRIEADPALFDAYYVGLSDLPIDVLEKAMIRAGRESDFFPSVKKIRDCAGCSTATTRSIAAWTTVEYGVVRYGANKTVDFGATINAAIRAIGGWEHICTAPSTDFDHWYRQEFLRLHGALDGTPVGEEQGAPLLGLHARTNAFHGHTGRDVVYRIKAPDDVTQLRLSDRRPSIRVERLPAPADVEAAATRKKEIERAAAKIADLERQFGERLDTMPTDELHALAGDLFGDGLLLGRFIKPGHGLADKSLRWLLMERMQEREQLAIA